MKFVPKSPIDYKSALVQVIGWCQIDNKPLPEPMITRFTDTYTALGGDELTLNPSMDKLSLVP